MLLLLQQLRPSLVLSLHLRLPCTGSDWRRGMFARTMCFAAHHASASENGCTTFTCRKQPHYCLRLRTDRGMLFVLALARPVIAADAVMQVPLAMTSWWYWCCSFFLVHPCFYSTSSCSGCTSGVPVHCDHRQLHLSAASVLLLVFVSSVVSNAVVCLS